MSFAARAIVEKWLTNAEINTVNQKLVNLNDEDKLFIKYFNETHDAIIANNLDIINLDKLLKKSLTEFEKQSAISHATRMYLLISSSIHHLFLNLQTFQNVLDASMIHKRLHIGTLSFEGLQHAVDNMVKMAKKQNLLAAVDLVKTLYKFPTSTVVTKTGFRIILSTFLYRKEFRFRMFSYKNAPLRFSKDVETSVSLKKHILGVSKKE